MGAILSSNIWSAIYADPTYYAGGGAAASKPLEEVSLIQGTDTLVAINNVISSRFPTAIPERKVGFGLGAGLYPNLMKSVIVPPGVGNIKCWLQTDDWFDYAKSGTFGVIPTSFTWHTDNGEEELDHFGCWVEKYVLDLLPGFAYQDITIHSRSWKAGNAMTKVAYDATEHFDMKDVDATNTLFDGKLLSALQGNRIRLSIDNNTEKRPDRAYGLGDYKIQQPRTQSREVFVEIWHMEQNANTWAADIRHLTAQLVNIDIVPFAGHTIDLNNMLAIASKTDENTHGIKQHYHKFGIGVGFAIA